MRKKLSLRTSIVEQVDASLIDPLSNEPRYGAWGELVEHLLEQWLEGKVQGPFPPFRAKLDDLIKGPQ